MKGGVEMNEIGFFYPTRDTIRFKQGQRVLIMKDWNRVYLVKFKWRGDGKWVDGTCKKTCSYIGPVKIIGEAYRDTETE